MTTSQSPFPFLFSPLVAGSLCFKNRALMAPMTTALADAEGLVTSRLRAYYRARAAGGAAAVIVEGATVHPSGKGWPNHLSAYDYHHLDGLSRLAADIKQEGALAILQIMHCGRQTQSSVSGFQPLAPSPIACPRTNEMPRELTALEVRGLVEAFAQATEIAADAGFDAVELHAAHGYLISQFLSPYSNKRTDEYGGSLEGRTRFLAEIVARIREIVGKHFPLLCRISADEFVPGGIGLEEAKAMAQVIARLGVAAIHVSAGGCESYYRSSPPAGAGEGVFADLARDIKSAVGAPVIAVGRILTPHKAEEILAQRKADLIAFGRALIADPELPSKAQRGQAHQIIPCVGCNVCNHRSRYPEVTCLTNPLAGRENDRLPRRKLKRKVLVAGAGLAALNAALLASRRGCAVTIADPRSWPGGLFHLRRLVPGLQELGRATESLVGRLQELDVELQLEIPEKDLVEMASRFDLVLAALPGSPRTLPLEIIPPPAVAQGQDVLSSPPYPSGRALVIGGNLLAAEAALSLARAGWDVHLVEQSASLLDKVQPAVAHYLLRWLEEGGVSLHLATSILSAQQGMVEIESNGRQDSLRADMVVLSLGYEEESPLISSLRDAAKEFQLLGDAYDPSDCLATVFRAFQVFSSL